MMWQRLFKGWCVLSMTLLLSACANTAKEPSLYEALGQQAGIDKITHQLILNFARDERVKHRFKGVNMQKFKAGFVTYVCAIVEGPCQYKGDDMKTIHSGYRFTNTEFNAVVDNLILAMERCAIPVSTQNRLLAKLAPSYDDVVYR
ncbi:globin [Cellvibrio mixtus]|uniref:Globin n=1 Tax=Cellvibrio mixtus TaxID=39650 RepID=A0A266QE85_9GAMM|nr:group 1 truncated hemoglobin [Cellvibrio mixtus]OZY87661.1 globin [Cellvibrio mixtus]